MGTFADGLQRFAAKVGDRSDAILVATGVELQRSVKFGSEITGAPEMPVAPNDFPRAGALRDSITLTFPDKQTALIYTTKLYATDVEDNPKGHTFNNGGPHGWKMTIAAFERVVDDVTRRITGYR